MRIYQKVLSFMALVILFSHNIQASTCDSISLKLMEQTWREFRAIHPFGFQTVGLKHYGDTCVFVMSEPAEWVKTEDLATLFTKYGGHLIECIQPYGYDGELHDFVGYLRKDSINSQLFKSELFKLLYYTDYKAYYTELDHPAKHVYFSNKNLNFNISSSYLRMMLFNERFKVSSKKCLSFYNLMKSKSITNKLYFSQERGFVVWVLDSIGMSRIDSVFLKKARNFALDTDIILGSIIENGKVAIIGREREVSVNILPPLRSETICKLPFFDNRKHFIDPTIIPFGTYSFFDNHPWFIFDSSVADPVLADSYSTPIKTVERVRNTELGSLMYLTDIILKSWCKNGQVNDRFINYPLPKSFPFPDGDDLLLGDSSKVYWDMLDPFFESPLSYNTASCFPIVSSFSTKKDSIFITKEIEMSCSLYSYFGEQQCIDLVRIKQYSILLNAFRHLTVGQYTLQGTSRQKTPSITVSNIKWLYGGFLQQGQVVKQFIKGVTRGVGQGVTRGVGQGVTRGVGQGVTRGVGQGVTRGVGQGVTRGVGQGVIRGVGQGVTRGVGQGVIRGVGQGVLPVTPVSKFRRDVIHPQPNSTKRGFDPNTHNKSPKELLLSASEKQEILDKSDKEKEMMEDLRLQLRQFNIPVKVILNEQRIIIHAINVLNNYDKGYEYEWAA